jgi:hypothetical protein
MAIYRLLENSAFGPEEIRCMTDAYEHALRTLRWLNRSDPLTEMLAKKIIAITRSGEHDPALISAQAIKDLGLPINK